MSDRKRKRELSTTGWQGSSQRTHLPSDAINPHSYPEYLLKQFGPAGLSPADGLPSNSTPNFPHRGLGKRRSEVPETVLDDILQSGDEGAAETGREKRKKDRRHVAYGEVQFETLLHSVHEFLNGGQIRKAARAYGLMLQLRPQGLPVDVRRHSLWAIGAEIIMREGEESSGHPPQRWGFASNIHKLKLYYETLRQQHPYDHRHPHSICAVDFWYALLGCEFYNTYIEHAMGLERVESGMDEDEEDFDANYPLDPIDEDEDPEGMVNMSNRRGPDEKRNTLRLQALKSMNDIISRLDDLLEAQPYSKSTPFLRLHAMASFYVADLLVPSHELLSAKATAEAERARNAKQEIARESLQKILNNGGELDNVSRALLGLDHTEMQSSAPLYSSLPIRRAS